MNPEDRRYSKEHEWARLEGEGRVRVGITAFATEEMGDIVFFDLPQAGAQVERAKKLGEVESVKAVSDLYAPISGQVLEVNQAAIESPEMINKDPWEKGWLLVILVKDEAEMDNLLTAQEYQEFTAAGEEGP